MHVKGFQVSSVSRRILIWSCIVIFIVYGIPRIFIFDVSVVNGSSMDDTLKNGDVVVARKIGLDHFERGNIVTVQRSGSSGRLVKRIVGLPGETVDIDDNGLIFVNGQLIDDQYQVVVSNASYPYMHLVLGQDEYFIIGDNRANSNDSRYFGAVGLDEIKDVILLRVFPFTLLAGG